MIKVETQQPKCMISWACCVCRSPEDRTFNLGRNFSFQIRCLGLTKTFGLHFSFGTSVGCFSFETGSFLIFVICFRRGLGNERRGTPCIACCFPRIEGFMLVCVPWYFSTAFFSSFLQLRVEKSQCEVCIYIQVALSSNFWKLKGTVSKPIRAAKRVIPYLVRGLASL